MTEIHVQMLGQSGCRMEYNGTVIYLDPYLSNSVQELDAPDLKRLVPIPIRPEEITDASWVLISHDHLDHCDPHTLPAISISSPNCHFMGPPTVLSKLKEWGVSTARYQAASEDWAEIDGLIRIKSVPAAHPEVLRDENGNLLSVGYVIEIQGKHIYHAGDTSVTEQVIDALMDVRPISAAFLPVNEHNFFLERRGIIGNMSVRDAFFLAEEIGINTLIPVHWDMFAVNSLSLEEIIAAYRHMKPNFDLKIQPTQITL